MVLRSGLLWLSERRGVFNFIKNNGLARGFASRFVAGESLDSAIEAVRGINADGMTATLDLLGESVSEREEAEAARNEVIEVMNRIADTGVKSTVSIKLTQMGLGLDTELTADNVSALLEVARDHGTFVRLDMESSEYVESTLEIFRGRLHPEFGNLVGVVIQSMLRRSEDDVNMLVGMGARVRLVKGAYAEPEDIAFPDKKDVDEGFRRMMERLLSDGNYPAIATHDENLIGHAINYVREHGIGAERFEFQMLYGVRRDLQSRLVADGFNVRVYVPYGTEWYPYLMRRLAERPANIAFMVGNVVKEALPWK